MPHRVYLNLSGYRTLLTLPLSRLLHSDVNFMNFFGREIFHEIYREIFLKFFKNFTMFFSGSIK